MNEVDHYIARFEPDIQARLTAIRQLFFELYPECQESMRYHMPAYTFGRSYLYVAAYKKHLGLYAVYGVMDLEERLAKYRAKGTKDSLHFQHKEPLPMVLIKEIIQRKFELR